MTAIVLAALLMYASIRGLAWRYDRTDRMLKLRLKTAQPLSCHAASGKDYWFRVDVGIGYRLARLIVPATYCPGGRLIVAADGITLLRREGNMEVGNGLANWAHEHGFALAIVYPGKTRYAGLLSGWNFPGGTVAHLKWRGNDLVYLKRVIAIAAWAIHPGNIVGLGFSAGVDLLGALVEEGDSQIDVLVSLSGMRLRKALPRGETKLLAFHGDNDPRLPWEGGVGRNPLTWLLIALGNWRVLRNSPKGLLKAYLTSFAMGENPSKTYERDHHTVSVWEGSSGAQVVLVKMHSPYDGHSFHGRESAHSVLARGHGQAAPREVVDPIKLLEEFFPATR